MSQKNEIDMAIVELHRRAELTSKVRYDAARRLMNHNLFSQWTLAVLAVGQIMISVMDALDLPSNYSDDYLAFGSIFFGVLVLAYSLLLGMANYSARSVKLHKCGLDLGELARELYMKSTQTGAMGYSYIEYAKRYYVIRGQYENHEEIDYARTKHLMKQGKKSDRTAETTTDKASDKVLFKTYGINYLRGILLLIRYYTGFAHYFVTVILMSGWLWLAIPKS